MMRTILLLLLAVLMTTAPLWSAEYTVDPAGRDGNPGTADAPFQTITKAASVMKAGDTCHIRPGTYRESVVLKSRGTKDAPIRFIGATRDDGTPAVVINGTDPLDGPWETVQVGGISVLAAALPQRTSQVFCRGLMMTEARWPDQTFRQVWDRTTWARSAEGSRKDKMVCSELAETGVDWTGAMATLNVGHQYKTWSRTVLAHEAGSPEFSYDLAERLNDGKDDGRTWWDDRFYLTGKIEALTSPEEWFHDGATGRLLFVPPEGVDPKPGDVFFKARDYGLSGRNLEYVEISGLNFFGCTFAFQNANHLTIDNCRVLYPNYAGVLTDTLVREDRTSVSQTEVSGSHNRLRKISIAYGNTSGIRLTGTENRLENSIVHDICWGGGLGYPGVWVQGSGSGPCSSTVTGCTIYNTGNVGIWFLRQKNVIEYNDVYNSGLACKDIAAIHTGSPTCAGSVARYNWVHDSRGKGIRADDQSRQITFHHNVVWNCDEGMIVKGDHNRCYNNTILGTDGHGGLIIPTRPEPQKWWARAEFLDIQNANSYFCNNLTEVVAYRHDPLPESRRISCNVELKDNPLLESLIEACERRAFRPTEDSPLVDAGMIVPDTNTPYTGDRPDIGAYEFGGDAWRAGADWQDPSIGVELTIRAEVARSWELSTHRKLGSVPLPTHLRESGLSESSLSKLQTLFDDCWTPEEITDRAACIKQRTGYDEGSAEYKKLHQQVVAYHRQANDRLKQRAGEVLADSELVLFHKTMK